MNLFLPSYSPFMCMKQSKNNRSMNTTDMKEMKTRECPYCHKKVAIKNCLKYIVRGTKYSTTCNHCGNEIWLEKEPLPFLYCVSAGFLIAYIPMQFCIHYWQMDFISSLIYCLPLVVFAEIASIILTMKRIYFKK